MKFNDSYWSLDVKLSSNFPISILSVESIRSFMEDEGVQLEKVFIIEDKFLLKFIFNEYSPCNWSNLILYLCKFIGVSELRYLLSKRTKKGRNILFQTSDINELF